MPIYEYRCEHCGDFEEMQRITDAPLARCPRCKRKVRRLISSTSFQLKGSGWYVTDYARAGNGSKKDAGAASETKSESKSTDGKSAETKSTESKSADTKAAGGGTTEKPTS